MNNFTPIDPALQRAAALNHHMGDYMLGHYSCKLCGARINQHDSFAPITGNAHTQLCTDDMLRAPVQVHAPHEPSLKKWNEVIYI